jgi:beta-lactamase class A
MPAAAGSLRVAVAHAAAQSSGDVAVYARAMDGSPPLVTYHDHDVFPAASIIKLLIMVCAFRYAEQVDPGLFNREITLRADDMVGGSEDLYYAQPGQRFTIGALVHAMITVSDNTAANALITEFGFDRINLTAHRVGLQHTQLRRHFLDTFAIVRHIQNLTTARDMGTLLYGIERGAREGITTLASPASCRRMINILLQQEDREKIAQGLPPGVPLANKTGEITGVRNDVGIVDPFGDVPYVLAILTKDLDDYSAGVDAIVAITRDVHHAMMASPRLTTAGA